MTGARPVVRAKSNSAIDVQRIRGGDLEASFNPALGGRMTGLYHARYGEILVPMRLEHFDPRHWPKAGAFPLFPFHNRVRRARFHHDGRLVNLTPLPHFSGDAMHGPSHLRPWKTTNATDDCLTMELKHSADDAWPFDFIAAQTFRLSGSGVEINLTLTNCSRSIMPGGVGWHPYFKSSPDGIVATDAKGQWLRKEQSSRPVRIARQPRPEGEVAPVSSTNHYSHWTSASVAIENGARITMLAGPHLTHLVVHRVETHICLEPASHVAGALEYLPGTPEGTGLVMLEPNESLAASAKLLIA